ncbi:30S ribosomal protein S20 [Candidatus Aerophobetes bacterium]|nr:30S ribosomal protein S20 [Candidatus Aerophobetes bacterium]
MAHTKSAKKRMRQAKERAKRNRQIKNRVKNSIKKLLQLINGGNIEEAKNKLPEIISLIDSAWAKGVWHKNKVAREKSRLMKKISQSKS